MTSNILGQGSGSCTANITKNRNRLKIYKGDDIKNPNFRDLDGFFFLNDEESFEIEMFNPHSKKVLAKIYLNGKLISQSGIVLRPGERIFLDRFIDENRKFKFSTYHVGSSKEAQEAIKENGVVKIEFYHEYIPHIYNYGGTLGVNNFGYPTYGSLNIGSGGLYSQDITYTNSTSVNWSSESNNLDATKSFFSNKIETGTVEKGSTSNQHFEYINADFYSTVSEKFTVKILPGSTKPAEMNSIRNYCSNCGTRVKDSNWKFCPKCGNRF